MCKKTFLVIAALLSAAVFNGCETLRHCCGTMAGMREDIENTGDDGSDSPLKKIQQVDEWIKRNMW